MTMGSARLQTSEPRSVELGQRIDWLGLGFRVPADWEIVRHASKPEHGALVFVDRRRERLRVSWTSCEKPPDLARLLADFSAAEEGESVAAEWQRPDGTRGFARVTSDEALVRAVRYDPAQSRLLELALSAPDAAAAHTLTQAVLDSFSRPPTEFALSAFGLSVRGPTELALLRADVRPMDTCVQLALGKARLSLRKLGAAESWFGGDYRAWLCSARPTADFRAFTAEQVRGHDGLRARGRERGPLLKRALGRLPALDALLWLCPNDNALYELYCAHPVKEPLGPSLLRVACCGAQEEPRHG
jgi:hypothetical protein